MQRVTHYDQCTRARTIQFCAGHSAAAVVSGLYECKIPTVLGNLILHGKEKIFPEFMYRRGQQLLIDMAGEVEEESSTH